MLETGVPNLDLILGGGAREGDVLLVVGPPGAGKTSLTVQIAFHAASLGQSVLYVSTLSEAPNRLLQHARSFSFYDEGLVGKHLFLLSVYPLVKQSLDRVSDALAQAVQQHGAKLVVVDGLTTVRDLHPEAPELRNFIYELGAALSALDCTTLITSSRPQTLEDRSAPELTMVDGVIELGMRDVGTRTLRTIQVRKARGQAPLLGQHALRIHNQGVTVYPRLESVYVPTEVGLNPEKLPLGLPEFDAMMFGGLPLGSVTLLAGSFGTGKTLTCLHFIMEGARRGERGLLVGFREAPRLLMDRARVFGLDLEGAVEAGLVTIHHRVPIDLVFDEVIGETWREAERFQPRRLVLDSVTDLQEGILEDRRQRGLMSALVELLRGQGITSIITREVSQVVGSELDFSDTPLAVIAENLLLLRLVEFRGQLHRIVSILKMRDTRHDHAIRQYVIGEQGMKVLRKMETAEGLLTGIARSSAESRARRETRASREGDAGL